MTTAPTTGTMIATTMTNPTMTNPTTTDPEPATRPRSGASVRVRIVAAISLLVTVTLVGAGIVVYLIERQRLDEQSVEEVNQEFAEFSRLQTAGTDPETGDDFASIGRLLTIFLQRNVPDDDELLVGWVGDEPEVWFPDDALVRDDAFLDAARPLVADGGWTRLETRDGEVLIASQQIVRGAESGALIVVLYLDEDRAELFDTMRTYAIVSFLSLLLLIAIAIWQSGRLLAPLRVVRETADEITETDLSRRLPVTGNDDITALTRTFNGMLDRLDNAFTAQRQLLDDAGHELRTPLTILQGHLELLDSGDPVEVDETRTLLLDEVDRMARLVDDLILLAKTERPGFLSLAPVDAAELTEAVAAKAAGLGDRAWSVDGVADVTVPADQQRITQALLQLAHNAVKHTGPGDAVALGSAREGDAVLFWVRDTGPGVAPEDRSRIFERFGRAHDADDRNPEGFGLGLSIVTAIARAHGGDAWLDDDYDEGARFVLSVPLPPGHVEPTRPQPVLQEA
ncbi:ATP-binding protein [Nocardioides sp. C4-1]|uniref:sensor histidine kinase n=1 Tax=Nocardioides sp. C4-1 TaxID=3151851 RepID=UPI0032643283